MSAHSITSRGLAGRKIPQGTLTPIGALLFSASEPGAWYDPSDLSSLFQDSAGTTPVTAVEQPVGRMLDKSGRGNHATQATTTKRPVLSRRVNTFLESEFRNGLSDAQLRGGLLTASALPGYLGAIAFAHDGLTTSYSYKTITGFSNTPVIFSLVVRMDDGSAPRVGLDAGPLNDFRVIINGTFVLPSQQEIAPGVYRLTASATITSGGSPNFGAIKYGIDSTKTFKVTAYDLRLATDAHLPYQRVNTSTDYDADTAKFPAYLRFDGVDDALQTANIDFTSTDKMTAWAGITKLSNSDYNLLLEHGTTAANADFVVWASLTGSNYRGDAAQAGGYAALTPALLAPRSDVLSLIGDRASGRVTTLRVAGGVYQSALTAPPGGNYTNHDLYIGARAGTAVFFNGRLYSLIVRGAQTPLSQIEATELYIKQKMRMP